jgi:proteasome accessory factor A
VAVPKVCGIETEYGIIVRGAEGSNPVTASSTLVNAYVTTRSGAGTPEGAHKVDWDFEDETPSNDARGGMTRRSLAPEVETHLVNAVLTNGSRFYVDHAHPELSTPECSTAHEALLFDRAGEQILLDAMEAAKSWLQRGLEIVVYKNNSDGKGQSYGCHENYLLSRELPFTTIITAATAHFVTRPIFCGAGKVGSEFPGRRPDDVGFQLTQRADFFEEPVGLETTLKRPIINTRDEPHADPKRYRRLHVIVGDANMSETATLLKLGTTALWLAAVEDGAAGPLREFANPVTAFQTVSGDLSLTAALPLVGGTTITALEMQWELLRVCQNYADSHGLAAVGEESGRDILRRWEQVLTHLERDPDLAAGEVDWVAKRRLIEGYQRRHSLEAASAKLRALDLQYHDLRPERSLAHRVGLQRIVAEDEVITATENPPGTTRAWFRGTCLQRYSDEVVAANWDSLVFDTGAPRLQRVPMMDPVKGTREQLEALVNESPTAKDLLERLQG